MKYVDKFSKEELLDQINKTRQALMSVVESVYKFAGNIIDKNSLIDSVNIFMKKDKIDYLKHKYIEKDIIDNLTEDLETDFEDEELEELNIIEK